MAEITASAYSDLRNYIQSNWQYLELQDDLGTAIIRLSPADSRVTSTIEGNNVKITVVVKGSDSDITAPKTFAKSVIYKVATGGEPYSTESFTSFTIEGEQDELTVIHTISVPQV
ncbi:hypothetical protein [Bacillus benzoevorans]|uniref:Uncharacterized protein n=1 Tax=Bacillus benzoevorans TaxID=1456 RepID=A0A7X0LWL3_9BACI|nr:hypothetical protein [Bacillus benzoevorans]MBB6445632.1 hypothetical protein [Bacillus benzoevorans]